MLRRHLIAGAAGAAALGLPGLVQAQEFPRAGMTVKYIVPFPPGGLTDVMARSVGQKLAEAIKVPVVVENRAGGNAQIGADLVAKSPPDGGSLLAITLAHAANVTLFPDAPYNLLRDLRPVALLVGSPMLIVVPANSPITDFKDLMRVAKTRTLNAGSSGNGTPPHLTMALFNDINQSSMTHVPYRGGAPAIADLIGGQIDIIFSNFPESIAHVKAGKLRALALCSPARNAAVPDVPTTIEAGMAALQVENWTAVMAPARTPDTIIERYSREILKIMAAPDMAERATQQGFRLSPRGAEEFAVFLKSEVELWSRVIKAAKITAS
ncbi:MAG: tripartite tricarboxylate transporter substrate binding protein [Rhodoferax sp.]|jgi:tripartite-type tricarboxylate transporter receptor subunit TctC|nr:tripartite tricarboxylate transporter substrate binding protein [Rhodoferax sp.]